MSAHNINPPAVEGTAVVTLLERQVAVASWLLSATDDRATAQNQWEDAGGVALLSCGGIFTAVRAPAHLVWAAVGTEDLDRVDDHLRKWFDGGAVFMDLHSHLYYFLVPASTEWKTTGRELPGVDILGVDHFLGVPAIGRTTAKGPSYWCVPMDGPGDLCYPDEVEELLRRGKAARAEGGSR